MFQQDTDVTPVLFRVHRKPKTHGGEVTAVFPCEPAAYDGHTMTCYAHVGQHGGCDLGWYYETRPALPDEYADLKAELESAPYGYRFKVYQRINRTLRVRRLFHCTSHAAFVMPVDHAESLAKAQERVRRLENPDPASLDKRERERARRFTAKRRAELEREEQARERMAIDIELWKDGDPHVYLGWQAPMMLRLRPSDPNTLETSKGAHVPLADAVRVFRFAAQCKSGLVQWQAKAPRPRVGDFHVDAIDQDGTIHAGCHSIPWDESARMAASIGLVI